MKSDKRDLDLLVPSFRLALLAVVAEAAKAGVTLVVYCAVRDPWEQARLWRRSRSTAEVERTAKSMADQGAPWLASVLLAVGPQPGKMGQHVTHALPGQSWHQHGEAGDVYWKDDKTGEPNWDGSGQGYRVFGYESEQAGLEWGGSWRNFKDMGHVQARKGSPHALYGWEELDRLMRERFEPTNDERLASVTPKNEPDPGETAYTVYNSSGDRERLGLSWDGRTCPAWDDLPASVQVKWAGVEERLDSVGDTTELTESLATAQRELAEATEASSAASDVLATATARIAELEAEVAEARAATAATSKGDTKAEAKPAKGKGAAKS